MQTTHNRKGSERGKSHIPVPLSDGEKKAISLTYRLSKDFVRKSMGVSRVVASGS